MVAQQQNEVALDNCSWRWLPGAGINYLKYTDRTPSPLYTLAHSLSLWPGCAQKYAISAG